MLHAFNQKNVRRVLTHPRRDHAIAKNEDGVTSMVFSPLVFMPPASSIAVLQEIVGRELVIAVAGREPIACDLTFWPSDLRAVGRDGVGATRCEPDFIATLDFQSGASIIVVGEIKWDWAVPTDQLQQQLDRQLEAVAHQYPGVIVIMLTITKQLPTPPLTGTTQRSWIDVHRAAATLAQGAPGAPEGHWGTLVAEFLRRAEQMSFQGFSGSRHVARPLQPVFWSQAA